MTSEVARAGQPTIESAVASGIELATATGVYVAADTTRKRELQERYGFRRLDVGGDEVRR
ncbi:MAG: hypothetical protein Q7S35_00335 [Candidatus Limnocylindrales bacterium]|nr:hypothetical protein [Candidatus Limnocylindrales bacterium]